MTRQFEINDRYRPIVTIKKEKLKKKHPDRYRSEWQTVRA